MRTLKLFILTVMLETVLVSAYGMNEPVDIVRNFNGSAKAGDKIDYELPGDNNKGILVRGFIKAVAGQNVEVTSDALIVDGKVVVKWDIKNSNRRSSARTVPKGYVFVIAEKSAGKRDSVLYGVIPISNIKKSIQSVVLP